MLGLIEGLKHFRSYIYGGRITCFVDQKSLKYLITKEHPNKFSKYRLILEDFEVTVKDIKGGENKAADFLSRYIPESKTNMKKNLEKERILYIERALDRVTYEILKGKQERILNIEYIRKSKQR